MVAAARPLDIAENPREIGLCPWLGCDEFRMNSERPIAVGQCHCLLSLELPSLSKQELMKMVAKKAAKALANGHLEEFGRRAC